MIPIDPDDAIRELTLAILESAVDDLASLRASGAISGETVREYLWYDLDGSRNQYHPAIYRRPLEAMELIDFIRGDGLERCCRILGGKYHACRIRTALNITRKQPTP